MDGAVPEGWRVRLHATDGRICGAGVLVDSWRLVTCAHVVADALRADATGGPPTGAVRVEFPALAGESRFAMVTTGGWVPVGADGRGDLAVLILDQAAPEPVQPATLLHFGTLDGRTVRAYGHPPGQTDGVWALTRPVGYGGPGGEWVQMDGLAVTGRRVERGFSGAGVLYEDAVVGLIVAEDLEAQNRVAWMLPMEQVAQYLAAIPVQRRGGSPDPGDDPPVPRLPGTVPERRLSNHEQWQLHRRLVAVPDMLDRSARELYIHLVEQEIGDVLAWRRQRDESLDVWALISALLARPGSLRVGVGVLHRMHENNVEVAALEEFVERTFPDLLLEHRERVELEGLLGGVTRAWLGAAYRAVKAQFEPVVAITDSPSLIRHLEGFGRLRGGPPPQLLVFVDDLAHKIGGSTSVQLHRWIDQVGDRLEADRGGLRQLCDAAEARRTEAGQVVLAVQLQPDRVDADRYLMSAWVHYGQAEQRLLLRDDIARTLDEAAEQLDRILPSVPEYVSIEIDELMIEFILPQRLIGHPVERWDFDRQVFPRPLGIRYPVVVRSLERLRNLSWHDAWRRKWRWLAEHGHRADPAAIRCYVGRPGDLDLQALYSDLGLEDHPVCLVLPFPPGENESPGVGDEFVAGLAAGMPVIVWSRDPVDPVRFCGLVRETLATDGVRQLPRQMLRMRRHAARSADAMSEESSGGYTPPMGLLWDDADRMPESFQRSVRLRAP